MNLFSRIRFFFGQSFDDYIQRFLNVDDVSDINNSGQADSQTAMKYTAVFACTLNGMKTKEKRVMEKASPTAKWSAASSTLVARSD